MRNFDALNFFSSLATDSPSALSVKITKGGQSDFSKEDSLFIGKFTKEDSSILDVGSGSGLIVNKLIDKVGSIHCVEPFCEFSRFIQNSDKITVSNCSAVDFNTDLKFNIVTFFGIMQYFNYEEAKLIYKKYKNYLDNDGYFIIKNQFGIHDDVIVSGYSDELKKNYYSEYRLISKEIQILNSIGFMEVNCYDIYPSKYNRWSNTHFYAITAK